MPYSGSNQVTKYGATIGPTAAIVQESDTAFRLRLLKYVFNANEFADTQIPIPAPKINIKSKFKYIYL